MQSLTELFPVFLERHGDIPEVRQAVLGIAWNHCIGASLRQVTEPVSFHSGVLLVRVASHEWRKTLASMIPDIISRMNTYLKSGVVREIRLELK